LTLMKLGGVRNEGQHSTTSSIYIIETILLQNLFIFRISTASNMTLFFCAAACEILISFCNCPDMISRFLMSVI
jgi:hypothetical protein